MNLLGAKMADGIICGPNLNKKTREAIEGYNIPTIDHSSDENMVDVYNAFYADVMESESIMAN